MTDSSITLPSAVLFDLDGTLIDSYRLYLEAYRRALTPYLGYAPSDAEIDGRAPSAERRFLTVWLGEERAAECHQAMVRHYTELHATHCEGPYEGVREMLAGLRSAGLPVGIVTGKGRAAWEATSGAIDLGQFAVVVTEDDVPEPKPDPAGLRLAAEHLGVAAKDIAYIGDSISDLEAARRAGMTGGAALWPKSDPADRAGFLAALETARPEWVFERPADVVRTFAAWC